MVKQEVFQLRRRDLEAVILDEVLDAVGDEDVALLIRMANVTGMVPTLEVQDLSRRSRIVVVSLEDIQTLETDFAFVALYHFLAIVHEFGKHIRDKAATGTDWSVPCFGLLRANAWRCFGETVASSDWNTEPVSHCDDELFWGWGGGGMQEAEGPEVEFINDRYFGECECDGRNDIDDNYLLLFNSLAEFRKVECWHDVRGDAAIERGEYQHGNAWFY
jgi:hypothetical protein